MDVDVGIIYTYEDRFMTPLVMSLARSADGVRMRMILVDNASERGVGPWTDAHEGTIVLRNHKRLGYAENLNQILEASTARYALLLNTDMIFAPHEQCLTKMVRFMDLHPECGVSGCRLFHGDGSYAYPARRFQSLRTIIARRLGLSPFMPRTVNSYFYLDQPHNQFLECDWLSGCFLMTRRTAVDEVGLLDPRFRKYFEDVDFCLRMARGGWKVMLNGATYAYHLEQRSSRRLLSRDAWLHLQSYGRWLWKWGLHPQRHIVPQPHFALASESKPSERHRRAA